MHVRRIDVRSLAAAVAALGIVAALAGPALAGGDSGPPARTGKIHDDCELFSLTVTTSSVTMKAACRVSDENTSMKWSTVNLSNNIKVDTKETGHLRWGGSNFQDHCSGIAVEQQDSGVKLKATCNYYCNFDRGRYFGCPSGSTNTSLQLADYYEASSSGTLAVK